MSSIIVLNIPHASTLLPLGDIPLPYHEPGGIIYLSMGGKAVTKRDVRERYVKEREYMTDWYTDELFNNGIGKPLFAPVSRLICDMERFNDDLKEEMSTVGMGVCYTHNHDLKRLVDFKLDHKLGIIKKYYEPYHLMLNNYVAEAIVEHKCALLIDCHSFNNTPYRCDKYYDWRYELKRPDICIGTDPERTPEEIITIVKDYFEKLGCSVKLNYPFSGTMTPEKFSKDPRLLSIMIEVNRKLYLDWDKDKVIRKEEEFKLLKSRIYEVEKLLEDYMLEKSLNMEDLEPQLNKSIYHIKGYV